MRRCFTIIIIIVYIFFFIEISVLNLRTIYDQLPCCPTVYTTRRSLPLRDRDCHVFFIFNSHNVVYCIIFSPQTTNSNTILIFDFMTCIPRHTVELAVDKPTSGVFFYFFLSKRNKIKCVFPLNRTRRHV